MTQLGGYRVALLVNSTEYGGVEEHVRELGAGLVRKGDRVTVICPPTEAADRLAKTAADGGLDVRRLELTAGYGLVGVRETMSGLNHMLRDLRPDILHVHLTGYTGGRLAVLAGRWMRAGAVVCTPHLAPGGPVGSKVRAERVLLNRGVHRFLAVSQDSLDRQVRHLGQPRSRSAVVHNGVDLARFPAGPDRNEARRALGLPAGVPIIGTVGRLAPQKSTLTLVDALPAILAGRPDAHALVVGDGPLRDEIQDRAQRLGVAGRLHIVGFQTDVPHYLATMDVYVLPSLFEGLPISILEAMATGLPVVATRVDGVPEAVVEGVTGLLVPPLQPAMLAEAVLDVLSDPARARAMGEAARGHVLAHFSMDRFVASVRGEYGAALSAAGRSPEGVARSEPREWSVRP